MSNIFRLHGLILVILFSFNNEAIYSQFTKSELVEKLSSSDQNKLKKAETTFSKGKQLEEDANKLKTAGLSDKEMAKNEKKYNLKRLEISQYYQGSNIQTIDVLLDNINRFWKANKGNAGKYNTIKNQEDNANELIRKAKSLRKVADDLTYPGEKLVKIIEAEEHESKSIEILTKALYAYLTDKNDFEKLTIAKDSVKQVNRDIVKIDDKDSIKYNPDSLNEEKPLELFHPLPQASKDTTQVNTKSQKNKPKAKEIAFVDSTAKGVALNDTIKPRLPKTKPTIVQTSKNTLQKDSTILKANPYPKDSTFVQPKVEKESLIAKQAVAPIPKEKKDSTIRTDLKQVSISTDTSSLYGIIDVNEDQIDKFNKFMQTTYPEDYEKYIVDYEKLDYGDVNSLKQAWDKYSYGWRQEEQYAQNDTLKSKDSLLVAQNTSPGKEKNNQFVSQNKATTDLITKSQNNAVQSTSKSEPVTKTQQKTIIPQKDKQIISKEGLAIISVDSDKQKERDTEEQPASGFYFKVQIAASRVPLDSRSLKNIYTGPETIIELKEDNWYKYVIGEFNTYKQAKKLRNTTNVSGAFVIAYLNNKRIKITIPMVGTYKSTIIPSLEKSDDLIFRIQIAASKHPLSQKNIQKIYSGEYTIDKISEDGWFKYSFAVGSNFKKAQEIAEKKKIPGAFIIGYVKNKKIDLKEAIKISKSIHNF